MEFIADLHIHSKYSRATAKNLDFENLYYSAQIKGVQLIGTGDFTFPAWIDEIETKLEEAEPGLFSLKKEIADKIDKNIPENCRNPVRFILQTEISNIYKKDDRVRKNHNLIYFPDIKSVKKFNARLDAIGNIKSDGRPILGLDAQDLLSIMLESNDKGFFVPAHIWTPWFSMFGSKSGFDSIEECFGSLKKYIFAVETGLSSDPPMNWRVKDLDDVRLISSSDAHSPGYLGRNASLFDTDLSFAAIRYALENNDLEKYKGTLDMYPHQGKYHYDGHRKCNICLNPATTAKIDGICPACGRKVTYGVLNRVQELATRGEGYEPDNRHGFKSIIPLADILSQIFEVGPKTKKVTGYYNRAIEALGPELGILLDRSFEEIEKANVPLLAEAVKKMRTGDITVDPGFDGEFGKIKLFSREEKEILKGEKYLLFDMPKIKSGKKKSQPVGKVKPDKNVKFKPEKTSEKTQPTKVPKKKKIIKNKTNQSLIKPTDLLSGLNSEQQRAVDSSARAMIIQAGPGTGKTRTLTAKIAHLVSNKDIDPGSILALTFTNKAARELEQRIEKYLPKSKSKVLSATFHSFCLKLLKQYKDFNAVIADADLQLACIKKIMAKEKMGKSIKIKTAKKIDSLISLCKQNLLSPEDDLKEFVENDEIHNFKLIYHEYQSLCKEENVADFEDLIFMTVNMFRDDKAILSKIMDKYLYVFIDEYQDLNFGQYELVKMLCNNNHIVVIGDPDQSIYGFRGSDNKYFKSFANDFPGCEKILLNKNYRSTQTILDASFQMITKQTDSKKISNIEVSNKETDKIFSDIQEGKKLIIKETATEYAEAVAIGKMIEKLVGGTSFFSMDAGKIDLDEQKEYAFSDFAILYRTSRQCETFIKVFENEGIPFQAANKKNIYDIDGIKQCLSFCRIISKSASFLDFEIAAEHLGQKVSKKEKRDLWDKKTIEQFFHKIKNRAIKNQAIFDCDNEASIRIICKKTGLKESIEKDDKAKQVFEKLLSIAGLYNDLKSFLDAVALNQDADTIEYNSQKVSLLTMHAAKGLEFPVVFVAGCEQGLVPFARNDTNQDDKNPVEKNIDDIEEERRLFYVAMTRAMDILCLTHAKTRSVYGVKQKRKRSYFIDDIEKQLTQIVKSRVYIKPAPKAKQMEMFE
jgi:DNA helicase II / ATP-dependent DNA helicase PcrA